MNLLRSRIAGSVIVGVSWFVFIILFLAFYAGNFDFWQNTAIFLASLITAIGIVAVMWIRMIPI